MYNVVELFSGIGSQAKALKNLGYNINLVGSSEWDIHAIIAYDLIHNNAEMPRDIADMNKEELLEILKNYTFSNTGKAPLEFSSLRTYSLEVLQHLYLAIKRNNNYVDINAIIKEKSRTLTDIDAVVIDKATGEIALFQLKWQDPTDYSPFALKSKRSNYYLAAEKWLQTIEKWLRDSTNKEIASKLGIKAKYFNKEKVSIFVLGRRRGNYSGNKPYPYECAWSQWYQIIHAASYLRQKDKFTISNLYELIVKTNPFNVKIVETPVTFCYGKYRIKFGGRTFYR